MNWWQQPFFQVALPIIITFAIATLYQSKRTDDLSKRIDDLRDSLNKRFDAIARRLERIENLPADHDRRYRRGLEAHFSLRG